MSAPSSVTATPSLTSLLRIRGTVEKVRHEKNVMMTKLVHFCSLNLAPFPLSSSFFSSASSQGFAKIADKIKPGLLKLCFVIMLGTCYKQSNGRGNRWKRKNWRYLKRSGFKWMRSEKALSDSDPKYFEKPTGSRTLLDLLYNIRRFDRGVKPRGLEHHEG